MRGLQQSAASRLRLLARRARDWLAARLGVADAQVAGILDLFEERVYSGEVTPDGHFVAGSSDAVGALYLGGAPPAGVEWGEFWESRIHPDDWDGYSGFNQAAAARRGRRGQVPRRRRRRRHARHPGPRAAAAQGRRQRPRPGHHLRRLAARGGGRAPGGGERPLRPACSTSSASTSTSPRRSRTAASRSSSRARARTGCSAARCPIPRWRTGRPRIHPADRPAYDEFNRALSAGEDADVEYRLIGADGVTRWVHDRAAHPPAARRHVRDQRHRLRRLGAPAACAPSWPRRTRRCRASSRRWTTTSTRCASRADRGYRAVYRGPHRDALAGGPIPEGAIGDRLWESLVHPRRPRRVAGRRGPAPARAADRARVPARRPRRRGADRARPPAAAARAGRHALLRRRDPRRHRTPPARGRAAARPRRGRAARPHRRADRHVQPPPLRRDRRRRARRRSGRLRPAPARRRPLQAGQRRPRPRRRRRRARRARPPPAGRARPGGLPGPLGRRGVRGAAPRCPLGRAARRARPAAPRRRRAAPGRRGGRERPPDRLDRRHPLGRRAGVARRARRGRRPLPVLGQGPRPQPRAAVRGLARAKPAPSEPEAVGVARALALVSGVRRGELDAHASQVADLASQVAEQLGLPDALVAALPARRLAARRRQGRDPGRASSPSPARSTTPSGR